MKEMREKKKSKIEHRHKSEQGSEREKSTSIQRGKCEMNKENKNNVKKRAKRKKK